MNKKGRFILMLLAFIMSVTAFAQEKRFSGTIVDEQGEPIIGASIVQKGTTNGAVSDLDGNFSISVDPSATLVISYIGYTSQELSPRDNMRVVLKEDATSLDDVVVVGYGVQKKSVVTAAIAKVSADDNTLTYEQTTDDSFGSDESVAARPAESWNDDWEEWED